jgi:uncharacterized ferritin-like protein (DUF455 family)
MNVFDYAYTILSSKTLEGKLLTVEGITYDNNSSCKSLTFIKPVRPCDLHFKKKQKKFPNREKLKTDEGKAMALSFFANHELLAIEMMAQALLKFPSIDKKVQKTLISTIEDEQVHFSLYRQRMQDLGYEFGDFPVNAFFWNQMSKMNSFSQFYAVVALTFEQANLDFASYYGEIFHEMGDSKTAAIFKVVYDDEIKHVARGRKHLDSEISDSEELWHHYTGLLPENVTPNRAKGIIFNRVAREKAGLSDSYINNLESYTDSFKVTKRKTWKST